MSSNLPYIAEGFKSDCKKLINRFTENNDIRFEHFCEIWKEMNFSMVFLGRNSYIDLLEFCEEVMTIAKDLVQPPYDFKERIAGLYLLYGLYYKQPVNGVKIRVTLYEWQNIMNLFREIKEGEHLDALYVLSKLLDDSAFHHVLANREYCIARRQRTRDNSVVVNEDPMFLNINNFVQETDILENIDILCKRYKQKKSELNVGQKLEKPVEVFDPNIAQILRKHFEDLKRLNKNEEDAPSTSSNSSAPNSENPKPMEQSSRSKNYLSRMKPVKNRAKIGRGFDTESSEDEEEDIEEIDEVEDEEDEPLPKPSTSSNDQNELMVLSENISEEEFSD